MRGAHPERALERRVAQRAGLRAGETVLVALSGGSDSVALAALLAKAAKGAGAVVICAHVNHGTRPSAWQDEAVALACGAALGLRVATAGIAAGPADEASLRAARYAALIALARRTGANRVFTAHHAEDQTETVLLALFRGAGPDGLLGIAPRRELERGISLERPLLDVPKAVLSAYVRERNLPVAVDPGNAALGYRRNALRASLAGLRAQFESLDEAVARAATILRQERAGDPRALLRAGLRRRVEESSGSTHDLTFERLEAAALAIEGDRAGRHFLRPGVELHVGPARSPQNEDGEGMTNAREHRTA